MIQGLIQQLQPEGSLSEMSWEALLKAIRQTMVSLLIKIITNHSNLRPCYRDSNSKNRSPQGHRVKVTEKTSLILSKKLNSISRKILPILR